MFELNYVVVYLITYAFSTLCITRFFRAFPEEKVPVYREIIGYGVYYLIIVVIYIHIAIPMIMLWVNLIGMFLLSRLYEKNIKKNVLMVVLIYVIMIISECMGMIVCEFAPQNVWEQQDIVSQRALIIQCVTMSLNVQIYKKFKGMKRSDSVPWSCWGSVVMIQVLLVWFMVKLVNQMEVENIVGATLLLATVNYAVIYIYDRLIISEEERIRNFLLMEQKESYLREMDILLDSQKRVRGIYHDIKNHILVIRSYLSQENYSDLDDYLLRLQEETRMAVPQVYTGQPAVDSMLNYKMSMVKNNISIKVDTSIPDKINLDDFDIAVILGNLLDNAIEACYKVDEEKREITLSLRLVKNQFFVLIENPFVGKLKWKHNELMTSKTDKANHGIGLQNVKRVVDKYNGIMEMSEKDKIFSMKIMLYLG